MHALLMILSRSEHEAWAQALASAAGVAHPIILVATPAEAAHYIAQHGISPSHVVLDIGTRGDDILPEIDALAHQCEAGTRVIAVGDTADATMYATILQRGVVGYLPMPVATADALRLLTPPPSAAPASDRHTRVIVFMNAASGDGASTAALNTAYAISELQQGRTVLVDMDYQFGMIAKQIGLQNQYGIGDLFDHPERGVDAILIKRMVAGYGQLDVITAPAELRYMPQVSADAIHALISTLSESYDTVILDLPHVWLPWVASALQQSTHIVLVAQLWLKSVSHAARMMRSLRELSIPAARVMAVINRGGAKFKEAIEPKDFERVCSIAITHTLVNDIKTITMAEARAKTVMELPPSELSANVQALARALCDLPPEEIAPPAPKRTGLFKR